MIVLFIYETYDRRKFRTVERKIDDLVRTDAAIRYNKEKREGESRH